jgi:hypothetical protein
VDTIVVGPPGNFKVARPAAYEPMAEPRKDRPILEAVLQNIEVAIDAVTSNEVIAAVPVIGTAFKLCKGLDDLRSRALAAKLAAFLSLPAMSTAAAKAAIARKVQTSPDEARKIGEALFLVLDRFIDLDKPEILAKLFIAYVGDTISSVDLQRLAQAIDIAFSGDLHDLLQAEESVINGGSLAATYAPWMSTLIPSGLTINNSQGVGVVKVRNEPTPLGKLLWKAWRYEFPEA